MAGRIRQEDVDAVRERTDIVKVLSAHLQLRKAGADRYVGLCPFHPEKTPSFSVSPSKQAYYCFGCGEGGGVFRFLEKVENLTFVEAVERLANEAGITLRYEGSTPGERRAGGRRQILQKALGDAGRLYQQVLLQQREGADARTYLAERGITEASVQRFSVGYAPGYPDFILRRLSRTYSAEILVESGLVSKDESGGLRDRFRGRVMFPIHDRSGNPVGFGGRLLAGPKAPANAAKYVNSPESSIYHKGSLLYNLNRAKADMVRTNRALLVEGYTDVIALDQAGVREAVATCGTALGEEHVKLLALFTPQVILAFDSDDAGARAAERAFQFHERYPVDLRVLVLPEGQDPADFVLSHGPESGQILDELTASAVPLVEYMIDRSLLGKDVHTPEGQARAIRQTVEAVIGRLTDPVLREKYAGILADKVGTSTNSVLLELERTETATVDRPRAEPRGMPQDLVERQALRLLLDEPAAAAQVDPPFQERHFTSVGRQRLFQLISSTPGPARSEIGARAEAAGEQVGKLYARVANEHLDLIDAPPPVYARHLSLRLEQWALERETKELARRLEKLNPLKEEALYGELFKDYAVLVGQLRAVKDAQRDAVGSVS